MYGETNAIEGGQLLGDIALFTSFSLRMFSNLAVNETSDQLAHYLAQGTDAVRSFAEQRSTGGFTLIPFPGYHGRKKFLSRVTVTDETYRFDLSQKGFGIFATGYGFYAPVATFAVLRFLAEQRSGNSVFLNCLGKASELCGQVHLQRRITIANQNQVAMPIIMASCADNYGNNWW